MTEFDGYPMSFVYIAPNRRVGGGIGRSVDDCIRQIEILQKVGPYPAIHNIFERSTGRVLVRSLDRKVLTIGLIRLWMELLDDGLILKDLQWIEAELRKFTDAKEACWRHSHMATAPW